MHIVAPFVFFVAIHPEAFAVHGISAEDVAHAPPPFEGVYNFFKWVNKSPLVVHNARLVVALHSS